MRSTGRKALGLGRSVLLLLGLSLGVSATASAAPPDFVLRLPSTEGLPAPSSGAAQIRNPRGIAGDPETGHVYVAEPPNARISEYTAWGLFVKAWGWDVAPEGTPGDTPADELETCGPAVPEAEPDPSLCQAGDAGAGRGQFDLPRGLAVDSGGSVYVFDANNRRVQKFSPSGQFLLMFGGDVNKTKVEASAPAAQRNVCPVDPGDVCQAGISGEGPSRLDATLGDFIAYNPALDAIMVGDKGRVQIFNLDGTYREEIPFEGALGALAGKQVNGLDVDGDGNAYLSLDATEDLYKLSPAGVPLDPGKPGASSFDAEDPIGVAVDVEGNVYAIDDPNGLFEGPAVRVLEFSPTGQKLMPTAAEEEAGELFPERTLEARLTAIATNFCAGSEAPGNLYVGFFNAGSFPHVSYVDAYGSGPVGCEPPPAVPPTIGEQFATFVGREEATLRALINPRFWPDATYYVEYGTAPCAAGQCPGKAPLSPALLTDRTVNAFLPTAGVTIEGLSPATTYHYRFVAQSSGGGPVFGIDPDGPGPLLPDALNGREASFTTHGPKGAQPACPNDAFRIGPAAGLPDCRAYEMVSPLDKGNADVALGIGRNNVRYRLFEVNKSALSGERFTFTSATAFGDAKTAAFSSQYLAERGAGGWGSEAISPPRTELGIPVDASFGSEFQGFSEDLCLGWLRLYSVAPLTSDAVEKYPNLYRRANCAEPPAYAALTTKDHPPKRPAAEYTVNLLIKGFSADGSHTIFSVPDELLPEAPTPKAKEAVLYERTPAGLRFVCYLPSGKPVSEACAAGTNVVPGTEFSPLHNAISADGSRIFWSTYSAGGISDSNPGRIYVRIDGKETVAVSVPASPEPAFFWTAAEDGSKAIFQFTAGPDQGELYEFDVDAKAASLIADGVEGPMGASEDASRIYFSSSEDLDGSGAAVAGAHNLYLYEADSGGGSKGFQFVMALASQDVGFLDPLSQGAASRPVDLLPAMRAARITPDGRHATFMSAASPTPTGYDNRDAESGKAAIEVYRYDAVADELLCVSCNPTGARPAAGVASEGVFAAATIQGWEANHHAPRVISDDGSRIFFESHEALVPEDSNGTWDVYQWEEPGTGTCTVDRPTYSAVTGGCVDLISSGQSPARSLFLDATPSGDSVFFSTQSSLVGSDYGLNDVYVARVGGGYPEPVASSGCEGLACQSPPPPPQVVAPSSRVFRGPGNVKPRCPKGKRRVVRKGRPRCVKKRHRHRHRRSSRHRGGRR